MKFISLARYSSQMKGLDYYLSGAVKNLKQINEFEYTAIVDGSNNSKYQVYININKPRSSKCTCPFAEGNKVICKHMIATYFKVKPELAKQIEDELIAKEEEEEREFNRKYNEIFEYVNSLTEEEAKNILIEYLLEKDYY